MPQWAEYVVDYIEKGTGFNKGRDLVQGKSIKTYK